MRFLVVPFFWVGDVAGVITQIGVNKCFMILRLITCPCPLLTHLSLSLYR